MTPKNIALIALSIILLATAYWIYSVQLTKAKAKAGVDAIQAATQPSEEEQYRNGLEMYQRSLTECENTIKKFRKRGASTHEIAELEALRDEVLTQIENHKKTKPGPKK